jgi:hypothetical protein
MKEMNRKRSDAMVARFRRGAWKPVRREYEWTKTLPAAPEEIFPLLCPCREADWLPGWDAEILYSESGYAEPGCVFRTESPAATGEGVWVFTRHQEPHRVEIARFAPDVLTQIRASLREKSPGVTDIRWEYVLTGLTERGGELVQEMAETLPEKAKLVGVALDHYLREGEMVTAEVAPTHHSGFARHFAHLHRKGSGKS